MARRRRRPVRRTAVLPNDVNAPRQVRRYYAILVEFMEHKNSTEYALDKLFTREELLDITPVHLYRWMCFKTYGREDPGVDDNPIHARSTTMAYWKKAISYFMPNNGQAWTVGARDDGEGFGNPTRSREINRLITAVRRKETRGLGSPSQADRSCTRAEYLQAINLIGSYGTPLERIRHLAMIKFQLHLIGRADDTAHVKKNCLIQSTQFEDYLTVKMRWSKNVQEERDCPFQVILGSMNSKICLVLALALYLEKWLRLGNGVTSQWVFAEGTTIESDDIEDQDNEALNCKQNYTNAIREGILQNDSFVRSAQSGNLGSHSVKKYATTVCRRGGVGKDDIDYRARWKARRMQDRYTDMQLDWPDVRAASKLCDGGTCLYKVKDGLPVTNAWISTNVTPSITASFGEGVGAILGKALLWAVFDPSQQDDLDTDLRRTISANFIRLNTNLNDGDNPIERVEVIPSEQDGVVSLDIIPNDPDTFDDRNDGDGVAIPAGGAFGRNTQRWRTAIYAKISTTTSKVTAMEQVQNAAFAKLEKENENLKQMIRTLMLAPARRITGNGRQRQQEEVIVRNGVAPPTQPATLSRCPRTLELLWDEYENGIGGRKPAKDFTPRERGQVKHKYCRRKVFWTVMERLFRRGCTVETAIARIKRVYGTVSVTETINALREHERDGGHHLLR